jgi:hypothetical protein
VQGKKHTIPTTTRLLPHFIGGLRYFQELRAVRSCHSTKHHFFHMAQRKEVKQKTAQQEYNDSIRNLDPAVCGPVAFRHFPRTTWSGSLRLNVSNSYRKPVIMLSPRMNFPGLVIRCTDPHCSGHYERKKDKVEDRIIHGLCGAVYVIQELYRCSNGSHCPVLQKSFTSYALLSTSQCPDIIRIPSENELVLSQHSGFTQELRTYILNNSMTPQSFEDIHYSLSNLKQNKYLQTMLEYLAARDYYCSQQGIPLSSLPNFSSIDDKDGYNENPNEPTPETCSTIFKGNVEEYGDMMKSVLVEEPPCKVASMDFTFLLQKKEKNATEIPDPGYPPSLVVKTTPNPYFVTYPQKTCHLDCQSSVVSYLPQITRI